MSQTNNHASDNVVTLKPNNDPTGMEAVVEDLDQATGEAATLIGEMADQAEAMLEAADRAADKVEGALDRIHDRTQAMRAKMDERRAARAKRRQDRVVDQLTSRVAAISDKPRDRKRALGRGLADLMEG